MRTGSSTNRRFHSLFNVAGMGLIEILNRLHNRNSPTIDLSAVSVVDRKRVLDTAQIASK
jgi:hypothetical protein